MRPSATTPQRSEFRRGLDHLEVATRELRSEWERYRAVLEVLEPKEPHFLETVSIWGDRFRALARECRTAVEVDQMRPLAETAADFFHSVTQEIHAIRARRDKARRPSRGAVAAPDRTAGPLSLEAARRRQAAVEADLAGA